jgi:hypothetical protein
MPTFKIQVTRIGYATRNIEVPAADQQEAERLALATAGNYEFREHDAEYELTRGSCMDRTSSHQEPRKESPHAQT